MFEMEADTTSVTLRLGRAAAFVHPAILRGMRNIGAKLQSTIESKLRGGVLQARTGTLSRTISYVVVANAADRSLTTTVTQDRGKAIYGRIQNAGGVVSPKRGAFLTIPLDAAKTANGVPRFTAREVISNPQAYGYRSTFFHNGVLLGTKGKEHHGISTVVPLFVLKRSVTIPARPYMEPTLKELAGFIEQEIASAVSAFARDLGGTP